MRRKRSLMVMGLGKSSWMSWCSGCGSTGTLDLPVAPPGPMSSWVMYDALLFAPSPWLPSPLPTVPNWFVGRRNQNSGSYLGGGLPPIGVARRPPIHPPHLKPLHGAAAPGVNEASSDLGLLNSGIRSCILMLRQVNNRSRHDLNTTPLDCLAPMQPYVHD